MCEGDFFQLFIGFYHYLNDLKGIKQIRELSLAYTYFERALMIVEDLFPPKKEYIYKLKNDISQTQFLHIETHPEYNIQILIDSPEIDCLNDNTLKGLALRGVKMDLYLTKLYLKNSICNKK